MLSFCSSSIFSCVNTIESPLFTVSITSRSFLSASALASASALILLISSSDKFDDASILIDCSLLVALSFAVTVNKPFASMSNEISSCGIPFGAGISPSKLKIPICLFCEAKGLLPCSTLTVIAV